MTTKTKVAVVLVVAVLGYAAGRYTTPVKVVEKRVEVEKVVKNTDVDKEQRKETTKTTVTRPDGTTETKETTVTDTKKKTETEVVTDRRVSTEKEVTFDSKKVTISLMLGSTLTSPFMPPVYGLSATKPILGPLTVGGWGLSTGVFGLSLGVTF